LRSRCGNWSHSDDIRGHARNERLGVNSFYRGDDFLYHYLKAITATP